MIAALPHSGESRKLSGVEAVLGCGCGDHAIFELRLGCIAGDLGIERGHVVVVHDRGSHEMGHFEPAELFAMRAVGQHALKVAADAPIDQAVDLVEQLVGTGEAAGTFGGASRELTFELDDHRATIGRLALGHRAFDLKIAESIVAEQGMPGFVAVAFKRIDEVGKRHSLAWWTSPTALIDESFRVEDFGGRDLDRGTGRPAKHDLRPAGEVLAQIVDEDAWGRLGDALWLECLDHADRRGRLGHKASAGAVNGCGGVPVALVEAGLVPAGLFEAGVVVLAAEDAREHDWAQGRVPRGVGGEAGRCTVDEVELQLENDFGRPKGAGELEEPDSCLVVHPVAEHDAQAVGALSDLGGDIIGRVETALPIVRPTGIEDMIADAGAVAAQLVVAKATDGYQRAPNRLRGVELAA